MKISSITIQGFRGFNKVETIDFHEQITLIYAPNSYGKTSITEALEWLLYGKTSKIEHAISKDEYKGSYRNAHLQTGLTTFVEAATTNNSAPTVLRGELQKDDSIVRLIDGKKVDKWTFDKEQTESSYPFILQHALKYLLLVNPENRFQGFARLLRIQELEKMQHDIISLCTKPESRIPQEIVKLLQEISTIQSQLDKKPQFNKIAKAFQKGPVGIEDAFKLILQEALQKLPTGTKEDSVLTGLAKIREEATKKFFSGRVALSDYTVLEKQFCKDSEEFLLGFVTENFIKNYLSLTAQSTISHIMDEGQFLEIGIKLMKENPDACPFCGQQITQPQRNHIDSRSKTLSNESEKGTKLEELKKSILESVDKLRESVNKLYQVHLEKARNVSGLEKSMSQLENVLIPKNEALLNITKNMVSTIIPLMKELTQARKSVDDALDKVVLTTKNHSEERQLVIGLGEAVSKYVEQAQLFGNAVIQFVPTMGEVEKVVKVELDRIAGTEDVSLLVELLERRTSIEKKVKIEGVLDGLKKLRKDVDQFVAKKILNSVSQGLTQEVMEWYNKIRTSGDPDVHFAGFDLEKSSKGELKARKVEINATSYGKDLVSAVSCLSESKLNALGLCVSIAANLKSGSPFEFVVIDDPIQSWDADHEVQFIEVIRQLVDKGKQVIILSHNLGWIKGVRIGCRTYNGYYYELTSYSKDGPQVSERPWAEWKSRLEEVDAILKNPLATTSQLQRAEGEIRIVVEDLTGQICFEKKGIRKHFHKIGGSEVRKILIECGVDQGLVDRITQSFASTDPSHHAQANYSPNKERIQQYHSWAHELGKLVN